ncbi:Xaa-Pro peptidase family protein [uncultured Alsobacter sp.]|uniref:M24 family metallopeptidase n=1 Tax=uncultured Alsobacter sp. TaxID=1748258 RepID=UPI0025E34055|nr:Xaa-Pro peptidase family protein [uncultured Alsobacter sp.]
MKKKQRPAGLDKVLAEYGLDAVIGVSPENYTFICGGHVSVRLRSRLGFAVIPAHGGGPFLVTCSLERALTTAESWMTDIRTYVEFEQHPVEPLAEGLRERGLDKGRIGLDLDYLPASAYLELVNRLPHATFVDTAEAVASLRSFKTPDEIEIITRATRDTHRAVLDAMEAARLGENERTMCNRIANNMINNGADGITFMSFGSGKKAHLFHAGAYESVTPAVSEVIRFDVGAAYGSWSSDFARTYSTGEPTRKHRETYRKLLDVEAATIDMIKPGIMAEEVFFFCRDMMLKHGLIFYMPHVGHSLGIELHEKPMLKAGEKTRLMPGMLINVEPSTFDDEKSAFHTEDLLLITETGTELMTLGLAPPEIPVIGEKIVYP